MTKTKPNNADLKMENTLFLCAVFASILFQMHATIDFFLVPRFLALSLGMLLLVFVLILKKTPTEFRFDIVSYAFIGYLILHVISIFWAPAKSEAIFYSEKILLSLLVFWLASVFFFRSEKMFLSTCKMFSFAAVIYFAVAFSQVIQLDHLDSESMYAVNSISGHRNLFACFVFLSIPYFVFGFLNTDKLWRIYFLALLALSFMCIVLLQTRAVWLGTAVSAISFLFLFIIKSSKKGIRTSSKSMLLLSAAILFMAGLLYLFLVQTNSLQHFLNRLNVFNFSQSASGVERLAVWDKTLSLIKENFWFGVGAGNWQVCYTKFSISGISEALEGATFQRPHNDFLWILSETGIFGLISFLLLFGVPIFSSVRKFLSEPYSNSSLPKLLTSCTLIGFLTISFFDFPKERIELLVLSFLLLAYIYTEDFKPKTASHTINSKIVVLITLPMVALCVITGFYRIQGEKAVIKIYKAKNLHNPDGMIRNADKAMSFFYEMDPASMPIHWYKGIGYTQQNNYEKGFEEFQKAYDISTYNHIINNNLGVCLLRNGKIEESKKYFEESIRINPVYDEPKLNLAVIYFNEKNYKKALEYTKSANPKLARTQKYLHLISPLLNTR